MKTLASLVEQLFATLVCPRILHVRSGGRYSGPLSAVASDYLWMGKPYALNKPSLSDGIGLIGFAVVGLLVVGLNEALHRARRRIEASATAFRANAAALKDIYEVAVAEGFLTKVTDDIYLSAEAEAEMRRRVTERLRSGPGATVAEIRDLLGTTRKYAVPICEYLDRVGLTRREGDLRVRAE